MKVNEFVISNALEIVTIQEIKLQVVFDSLVHSLWENSFRN